MYLSNKALFLFSILIFPSSWYSASHHTVQSHYTDSSAPCCMHPGKAIFNQQPYRRQRLPPLERSSSARSVLQCLAEVYHKQDKCLTENHQQPALGSILNRKKYGRAFFQHFCTKLLRIKELLNTIMAK